MPHRIIIRHEAETDITNAAIWYQEQQPGLGDDFLAEIDAAITAASTNPFHYSRLRRKPEVRRVLTNRFPYRIFFIRSSDDIVIFRILHHARHDREWKTNIPKS
ncbi:MAG TPA: type II toxin-antitoxin system RelE/ParE family toxin [Tepidisphaeraceae bacterium]|jgi:plasmid stabilization system protein ParE|nr:type II toxin-antitoxin system RelE/ParE family toxin [Tepidisphaeraceae bacterium]